VAEEKLEAKGLSAYLPIVIATTVFAFVPVSMQASCMGIFFPSMVEDYNVQTSNITIYMTIGGLILAVGMPFLGKLLANHDIRLIASIQISIVAACFLSLAFSTSIIQVVISGAILMAASVSMLGLSNPTLINRWFKDRAGFVIGLVAAFTGIGGVVFIQVGRAVMAAADYRTAFIAYAIIILVVCLPFSIFVIRNKPSDKGMLPYVSQKAATNGSAAKAAVDKNWSVDVKAAIKSPAFWLVGICGAVANMVVVIAQFFPTYVNALETTGIAVIISGATLATIVSAGQAVCKLLVGATSDLNPTAVILGSCALGVIGILAIAYGPTTFLMPCGGAVFGFYYASVAVIMPILAGAVFGTGENYSIVYGRCNTIINLCAIPAGFMWPLIAETFGGYVAAFWVAIVMIIAFGIMAFLAIKLGKSIPRAEDTSAVAQQAEAEA
jgi:MFS transporter, OFA family, oxalate/formate antiporter